MRRRFLVLGLCRLSVSKSRVFKLKLAYKVVDACLLTFNPTTMAPKRRGHSSTSSKHVDPPQTPPQHFTPLYETPISKKGSGATPYTSMHYKRDIRMNNLGSEMKGKFAGPICPKEFLQVFLPFEQSELQQMPKRMKKPFQRVAEQKVETAMYELMVCSLTPPIMYNNESSRSLR